MAKKVETSGPKLGTTVLRTCQCEHEYQNQAYGRLRVHNVGKNKLTCTVCSNEKIR